MAGICSWCAVAVASAPIGNAVNCPACWHDRKQGLEAACMKQIYGKWQDKGVDLSSLSKAQVKARSKK